MKYIVTINGRNYEVEVERGEANIIGITENTASSALPKVPASNIAKPVETTVKTVPAAALQKVAGEVLKSPMPGMIMAVKVSIGSNVKKGDTMFILEAMKMENEITAPKDGIVVQITATKGLSVSTGDLLAVIE